LPEGKLQILYAHIIKAAQGKINNKFAACRQSVGWNAHGKQNSICLAKKGSAQRLFGRWG
jgi:hypothetical protein